MFTPMEPEDQIKHFRRHCEKIRTQKVVCSCRFCTDAINMGGKKEFICWNCSSRSRTERLTP